ncbi:MAG: AbrB family transcriptional regulator [Solirubrobacteraceae bacterium]|nr:AbrB family transcriptional regulator [Solirubrobacteraceae bacterium]
MIARRLAALRAGSWLVVAAGTLGAYFVLAALGVPAAMIFAALAAGIAFAFARPDRLLVGRRSSGVAQALIGVSLGAFVNASALGAVGSEWLAVLLVTFGALVVSLAIGVLLQRATSMNAATATLGAVPGGAVGIVAMARELGGDDRLVAFSQYLRVLVILLITPAAAALAFPATHDAGRAVVAATPGLSAWALTIALAAAGWLAGRAIRLPAASLLGPLALTSIASLLAPGAGIAVPPVLLELAFALVGLDVGLRFTRQTVLEARALLTALLVALAALLLSSFALALALAAATPMSLLDSYLATTPGGFTVVAAAASDTGADTALVVGVQSIRMLVMVALAPLAVRMTVGLLEREQARARCRVSAPVAGIARATRQDAGTRWGG